MYDVRPITYYALVTTAAAAIFLEILLCAFILGDWASVCIAALGMPLRRDSRSELFAHLIILGELVF